MALASVIVASPHPLTAEGVVGLLKDAGYKVPATIGAFNELAQAIAKDKPDMVLVDGSMLANNLEELGSLASRSNIAILVGPEKGPVLRAALVAGARGFISVDVDAAQFIESMNLLLQGALIISAKPGELMVDDVREIESEDIVERLSGREQQLAILVAGGASNKEIAEALSISEHTVKVHLGHILTKLDLRNRQQVAVYVAQQGVLEDIRLG